MTYNYADEDTAPVDVSVVVSVDVKVAVVVTTDVAVTTVLKKVGALFTLMITPPLILIIVFASIYELIKTGL